MTLSIDYSLCFIILFLGNFFPRGGNQNQGQYHRQNFGRQGGGQDWNRQRRENRAY